MFCALTANFAGVHQGFKQHPVSWGGGAEQGKDWSSRGLATHGNSMVTSIQSAALNGYQPLSYGVGIHGWFFNCIVAHTQFIFAVKKKKK